MLKNASFVAAVALFASASMVSADQPILVVPAAPVAVNAPALQPVPQPAPAALQPVPFQSVPLFENVRVKHERRIPCKAVPMLVTVKDPCACEDKCCCSAPKCVNVLVCVPACQECPPRVTCKKDGSSVKYDFGKYRVEVRSKKGVVEVAYH